mmetsp:Transcript_113248/g.283613  ORF Transcript_113248/g.283613 Transcript_113248/m.283613 type:complete len:272 (-) Transcript_113248:886-1701(-)
MQRPRARPPERASRQPAQPLRRSCLRPLPADPQFAAQSNNRLPEVPLQPRPRSQPRSSGRLDPAARPVSCAPHAPPLCCPPALGSHASCRPCCPRRPSEGLRLVLPMLNWTAAMMAVLRRCAAASLTASSSGTSSACLSLKGWSPPGQRPSCGTNSSSALPRRRRTCGSPESSCRDSRRWRPNRGGRPRNMPARPPRLQCRLRRLGAGGELQDPRTPACSATQPRGTRRRGHYRWKSPQRWRAGPSKWRRRQGQRAGQACSPQHVIHISLL